MSFDVKFYTKLGGGYYCLVEEYFQYQVFFSTFPKAMAKFVLPLEDKGEQLLSNGQQFAHRENTAKSTEFSRWEHLMTALHSLTLS